MAVQDCGHPCTTQHQSKWALTRLSPHATRKVAVGKRAKLCKRRFLRIAAVASDLRGQRRSLQVADDCNQPKGDIASGFLVCFNVPKESCPIERRFVLIQKDVLIFLIEKCPGRSEQQLSEAIFGSKGNGYQQRVNQDCRMLADRGEVERRGNGGPTDPYRYFPKSKYG